MPASVLPREQELLWRFRCGFRLERVELRLFGLSLLALAPEEFDAVMCNQVVQYVVSTPRTLRDLYHALKLHGYFVMTFATNWDEVEDTDLQRYTRAGMIGLLKNAGFTLVKCERRAEVTHNMFRFPLGYGVVARKDRA